VAIGHLLTSQADRIFELLRDWGFSRDEFEWQWRAGEAYGFVQFEVPVLVHLPTEFFFAFSEDPRGGHAVYYTPGADSRFGRGGKLKWDDALAHVVGWITSLRRESEAKDFWGLLAERSSLLADGRTSSNNAPFSLEEQQRVRTSMDAVYEEVVRTQRLNKRQTELLLSAIEESKTATARLGRRDWLMFTLSTLAGVATSAAFSPEVTRALVQATSAAVGWITGSPTLPAP
jgi:hypothetical protein